MLGANGSGKSNFIGAFALLKAIGAGSLQTYVGKRGVQNVLHFGPGWIAEKVSGWMICHFHDTSEFSKMRLPCALDDNRHLRADGSNLLAFLYLLKEKHATTFRRLDADSLEIWLEDYSLGELWEKNHLGGRPKAWLGQLEERVPHV